jgi:hypothetical protein
MTILQTLYASGGTEVRMPCLSFRCSEWASIHICQGYEDITATLETAEVVTFTAADFGAQLAERGNGGRQNLQFIVGVTDAYGLDNGILEKSDAAMEAGAKIFVDYREFLLSDLTAPAQAVQTLTVMPYEYELGSPVIAFSAGTNDTVNKAWPRRRYTSTFAPGLKYYGS